jgi:hypothetical protein
MDTEKYGNFIVIAEIESFGVNRDYTIYGRFGCKAKP